MSDQLRKLASAGLALAAICALAGAGQAAPGTLPGTQVAQTEPSPSPPLQHDQTASADETAPDQKPAEPRRAVRVIYPSPYEVRRP